MVWWACGITVLASKLGVEATMVGGRGIDDLVGLPVSTTMGSDGAPKAYRPESVKLQPAPASQRPSAK